MSEIEHIEQGPSGSYGDAVATGDFEAAPRTVGGFTHPDSLRDSYTDPREGGSDALDDLTVPELVSLAESEGVEGLTARPRKADAIAAIEAHRREQAAGVPSGALEAMTDEQLIDELDALGGDPDGLTRDELIEAIEEERAGSAGE